MRRRARQRPVRLDGAWRRPVSNSEFELNRECHGGMLSLVELSLDGDVRTTMAGADYSRGPLPVGLSGRTLRLGGYRGPSGGRMSTSMTGFYA